MDTVVELSNFPAPQVLLGLMFEAGVPTSGQLRGQEHARVPSATPIPGTAESLNAAVAGVGPSCPGAP